MFQVQLVDYLVVSTLHFFNLRQKIWRMIHTCAIFKGVAPHQHKEKSMRMWFIHCWGTVPQVRPI